MPKSPRLANRAPNITADTGFLIGVERRKTRAMHLLRTSKEDGVFITVPTAVLTEWWRGSSLHKEVLKLVVVEPLDERLAKIVAEAMAAVAGATVVDTIVMASAASRGDIVYTSDFDDLTRLREQYFASVKILIV